MRVKKLTRSELIELNRRKAAERKVYEYNLAINEGISRGKKAAEEEFQHRLKRLEVKEHVLRAMAQMMEAAAHLADNLHSL